MLKTSRILLATTILFAANANARESFYNLGNNEPSISLNLGALDHLEQPAYASPPPPVTKKYRTRRTMPQAETAQTQNVTEPSPPKPSPRPSKSARPGTLPVVMPDTSMTQLNLTPPPPIKAEPPKPLPKIVDQQPSKSADLPPPVKETAPLRPVLHKLPAENTDTPPEMPPPPPMPKTAEAPPPGPKVIVSSVKPPVSQPVPSLPEVDLPPPPPLAMKKQDNNLAPPPLPKANVDLPAPPALPSIKAADNLPPPPPPVQLSKTNRDLPALPMPSVKAADNLPPPLPPAPPVQPSKASHDLPAPPSVPSSKADDNIVALPPAPPSMPSAKDKTLVASSRNLDVPPPLPNPPKANDNGFITLPPPPANSVDLDKKIADEKAKINNEQIKTQAAIKSAGAKMPSPKDLAKASIPDLPPMPPPPAMDINSLPPLPMAPGDVPAAPTKAANSDLPSLDKATGKQTAIPKSNSVPSKETVMVQPDKISSVPAISGKSSITMPYSEAETELPLVEKPKLEAIISELTADKSKTVTVIAYASGTPEQASQAKRTSLARVLAVRKYLMERNIDAERINPRPLGNKAESGVPDRVDVIVEKGAKG